MVLYPLFVFWTTDAGEIKSVPKGDFDEAHASVLYSGEADAGFIQVTQAGTLFWSSANAIRTTGPKDAHARLSSDKTPRRLSLSSNDSSLCWAEWEIPLIQGEGVIACGDILGDATLGGVDSFVGDPARDVALVNTSVHWTTAPRLGSWGVPAVLARRRRPLDSNATEILFEAEGADIPFVTVIGQHLFFAKYVPDQSGSGGGPQPPGDTTFYRRHVDSNVLW
jgi:hypothetical protein